MREGGGRHMLGTGKRGRVGRNCRAGKKEWGRGGSRKGGREGGFFNCSIHPKLAGLAGSPGHSFGIIFHFKEKGRASQQPQHILMPKATI